MQPRSRTLPMFGERQAGSTKAIPFAGIEQLVDLQTLQVFALIPVDFDRGVVHRHDLQCVRVPCPHRQWVTVEEQTIASLAVGKCGRATLDGFGHLIEGAAQQANLARAGDRRARSGLAAFERPRRIREYSNRPRDAQSNQIGHEDGQIHGEEKEREIVGTVPGQFRVERLRRDRELDHPRGRAGTRESGEARLTIKTADVA